MFAHFSVSQLCKFAGLIAHVPIQTKMFVVLYVVFRCHYNVTCLVLNYDRHPLPRESLVALIKDMTAPLPIIRIKCNILFNVRELY